MHAALHTGEMRRKICQIARGAGKAIMGYYLSSYETRRKDDKSPVTDADIAAHDYIFAELVQLAPGVPIISEEAEHPAIDFNEPFWLVDPLDGTRGFVNKDGLFTVNIALMVNCQPKLGVIGVPQWDIIYSGIVGEGAYKDVAETNSEVRIHTRDVPPQGMHAVVSSHYVSHRMGDYLEKMKVHSHHAASSAVKFCMVAEGGADIYPRFGPTMEWDTAAGQAIIEAAGGRVETLEGGPFTYGKQGFANPAFVAWGK